jgi:hypothetical protein
VCRTYLRKLARPVRAQSVARPWFRSFTGCQMAAAKWSNRQSEVRSNSAGASSGTTNHCSFVEVRSLTAGGVGNLATSSNALDRGLLPSKPLLDLRNGQAYRSQWKNLIESPSSRENPSGGIGIEPEYMPRSLLAPRRAKGASLRLLRTGRAAMGCG